MDDSVAVGEMGMGGRELKFFMELTSANCDISSLLLSVTRSLANCLTNVLADVVGLSGLRKVEKSGSKLIDLSI